MAPTEAKEPNQYLRNAGTLKAPKLSLIFDENVDCIL